MRVLVEPLDVPRAELGEGPRWFGGRLHWVDILGRRRFSHDAAAGATAVEELPDAVTLALPRAGGGLVLAVGGDVLVRDPDGAQRLLARLSGDPALRCNDGACDPQGRLYVGTMRRDGTGAEGRLVRIEPDGTTTVVAEGCGIANGIGFDPARARMYFADSLAGGVDVWDLDAEGLPVRRRRFVDIARPALPDGLAVDRDGDVWVALHEGGAVRRCSPAGAVVAEVALPAAQVTACTFGGPGLTDLYVTTAREGFDADRARREPLAGSVFVARGAGHGTAVTPFAG